MSFTRIEAGSANKIKFNKIKGSKLKLLTTSRYDKIKGHLSNILVERVPHTESHKKVQQYITSQFHKDNWDVEHHSFDTKTPHGQKTFTNIIVTSKSHHHHPHSSTFILAAHYDSKYFKDFKFLGATDSAVPVSMMIDIAHQLEELVINSNRKLKLIFFDGEEAFEDWTDTDSLYGSRHLAEKWSKFDLHHPELNSTKPFYHTVDLFMLIDLIGESNPTFFNMDQGTEYIFKHLSETEDKLSLKRLISVKPKKFFNNYYYPHGVQDDHIPFQKHKVPILHLIPLPFPNSWHTEKDDLSAVDPTTVDDLSKIFRVFIASYFEATIPKEDD
eukprot:gene2498-3091_t